jgi:hypothetical protein
VNNQSSAEESNSLDNVGRDLSSVVAAISSQDWREKCKEGAAHADEHVGSHAGGLAIVFALDPHHAAKQARHKQAADGTVHHGCLLDPAGCDRLRKLCQNGVHSISLADATTVPGLLVACVVTGVPET